MSGWLSVVTPATTFSLCTFGTHRLVRNNFLKFQLLNSSRRSVRILNFRSLLLSANRRFRLPCVQTASSLEPLFSPCVSSSGSAQNLLDTPHVDTDDYCEVLETISSLEQSWIGFPTVPVSRLHARVHGFRTRTRPHERAVVTLSRFCALIDPNSLSSQAT